MENSLLEINPGILEAAEAMGATTWQTIRYFLLPETLGSIVLALTTGTIGLLGASAMAGYVGGGGVGDLALTYGYQRMNTPLMMFCKKQKKQDNKPGNNSCECLQSLCNDSRT